MKSMNFTTEMNAPKESWWTCRPEHFADLCRAQQARMTNSRFGRSGVLMLAPQTGHPYDYGTTKKVDPL